MKAPQEAMEASVVQVDNNYQEIRKLHEKLKQAGIEHVFQRAFSGYQIQIYDGDKRIVSVIEHEFSYGKNHDLVELLVESEISGWQTAEDCMQRIKAALEKRGMYHE